MWKQNKTKQNKTKQKSTVVRVVLTLPGGEKGEFKTQIYKWSPKRTWKKRSWAEGKKAVAKGRRTSWRKASPLG